MTLPSTTRMSKRKLFLLLVLVVISFILLIFFAKNWNSKQIIDTISVSGNYIVSMQEIKSLINDKVIGKAKDKISLLEVEKIVNQNPYIQSAEVSFDGNNEIEIEIKERTPIAFVVDAGGNLSYIDSIGKIMPHKILKSYSDMPFLNGIYQNNKLDSVAVANAVGIINQLIQTDNKFSYNLISEVSYDKAQKSFSLITSDQGLRIILGRNENIAEKCKKLKLFWKKWIAKNNTNWIKHVDLRWNHSVIVL